jgi:hypothetical protein
MTNDKGRLGRDGLCVFKLLADATNHDFSKSVVAFRQGSHQADPKNGQQKTQRP